MNLKTARMLQLRSLALSVAFFIASNYWSYWSALKNVSQYSRLSVEISETDLLRPCASLLEAKFLPTKFEASISTDP